MESNHKPKADKNHGSGSRFKHQAYREISDRWVKTVTKVTGLTCCFLFPQNRMKCLLTGAQTHAVSGHDYGLFIYVPASCFVFFPLPFLFTVLFVTGSWLFHAAKLAFWTCLFFFFGALKLNMPLLLATMCFFFFFFLKKSKKKNNNKKKKEVLQ